METAATDGRSRLTRVHDRATGVVSRAGVDPWRVIGALAMLLVVVSLVFPDRQDDEAGYVELARNITHGFYATGRPDALLDADPSYPDLWFGPGLPLALALPVAANVPLELLRLSGPIFVGLALVAFFLLLRRTISKEGALVATVLLGLYLPFYTLLPNLHSEPLAILLVVASMYATARLLEAHAWRWTFLGAGALAGVALTRVAYGWVLTIALAAFVAWWVVGRSRRARALVAMYALALALCVPWLAYTAAETGRALQWGNSGSLSLYWMASPYAGDRGDWQRADAVFRDPNLSNHRPFFESLRGLSLHEQNERLEREAVSNIVEHPLKYGENVVANISRILFDAPYSYQRPRATLLFVAVPNAVLMAVTILALILAVRLRGRLPAETTPFLVLASIAFALHALVAGYPRMLTPIVPLLVWLAAVTMAVARRDRRAAGGRATGGGVAADTFRVRTRHS